LKALKKVCKIEKIKIIEWDYNPEKFFEVTKGLESEPEKWRRCHKCYDFRLEETAKLAKELWIEKFTTTLSISPHKDVKKLFCIWEKIAKKYGNNFLKIDFRKNAWFERSVEYTKENKIYRQDYCGCVFSETYPNWINNKNTKK
jgi:predicted adenine nucleotide alpha hydrolase (AANH) superfamily ATPase